MSVNFIPNPGAIKAELAKEIENQVKYGDGTADDWREKYMDGKWNPTDYDNKYQVSMSESHRKYFSDAMDSVLLTGGDNPSAIEEIVGRWVGKANFMKVSPGMPVEFVGSDGVIDGINKSMVIVHGFVENYPDRIWMKLRDQNGNEFNLYNLVAHASLVLDGAFDEMVQNRTPCGYSEEMEILLQGGVLLGVKDRKVIVYYPRKEDLVLDGIMGMNFYPPKKGEILINPRIRQAINLGYYEVADTKPKPTEYPFQRDWEKVPYIPHDPYQIGPPTKDYPTIKKFPNAYWGDQKDPGESTVDTDAMKKKLADFATYVFSKEEVLKQINSLIPDQNGNTGKTDSS